LNIANSQTNGILNIGTNARSGAINVATVTGSTCGINILNGNGATTGGSVNIANESLQTTTVNIASGTGTGIVTIGNSANTVALNGAVTLAKPLTLGSLPTTALTVLGGSIKYSFVDGLVFAGGNITFGSFTNVPTGIYLLTVGTFTIYNLDPADRFDIAFTAATNITFISSSTGLEFGGNTPAKCGIGFTIPISVTNSTNQLTVTGYAVTGNANHTGGASSLLRIA
jgi:hypothetical protein